MELDLKGPIRRRFDSPGAGLLPVPEPSTPGRRRAGVMPAGAGSRRRRSRQALRHLVLDQDLFRDALDRERRRADRFEQPFLLALLHAPGDSAIEPAWPVIADAVAAAAGDLAILGWFRQQKVLGLIVPEIGDDSRGVVRHIEDSIERQLARRLDAAGHDRLRIRLHVHTPPDAVTLAAPLPEAPDPCAAPQPIRQPDALKRAVDIAGSLALLMLFSPLFLLIALLVKLTSPGPVIFRQTRIGQGARPFTMFKFRTMQAGADVSVHYAFVTRLIAGEAPSSGANKGLFKLVDDPRVTAVGRILRRTSLDELPQFWNVLKGDMSLVGPRPPLSYEVARYRPWHWRRVLDAKPGITGLWQVTGRSRTTFDEMVRLDLRYVRSWSFWTDVKILLATPRAVFLGKGAC